MPRTRQSSQFRQFLSSSRRAPKSTALSAATVCVAWLFALFGQGTLLPVVASEMRDVKHEPGLAYANVKMPNEPWSIHVLSVDRSRKDLMFFSAHAQNKVLAVGVLADQARTVPPEMGTAVAAINGDYYVRETPPFSGDPRGLQILNGNLISAPDTVCVWFDSGGEPAPG